MISWKPPIWLIVIAIIAAACALRIALIANDWPTFSSDEGTIGIAALHIYSAQDHPVFFYGQNYMGTAEAYIAAFLFHFLGVSSFTLRLGLVGLYALFLLSTYTLATLLYSRLTALVCIALLSPGSDRVLLKQLEATGGYAETLLCGSVVSLLAAWLALSRATRKVSAQPKWPRLVGYGAWGLAAGFGLWSDLLILPFVGVAALLLLCSCYAELRTLAGGCLLLGLCVGAWPLIAYNFSAAPGQDSLHVLLAQNEGQRSLGRQIAGVILISIPTATGGTSLCYIPPVQAWPLSPEVSSLVIRCSIVHAGWTMGLAAMWIYALFQALFALRALRTARSPTGWTSKDCRENARRSAHLMLLSGAGLALLLFVFNPAAAATPRQSARYLQGLFIALPAVIAPVWDLRVYPSRRRLSMAFRAVGVGIVAFIFMISVIGTIQTFGLVPQARAIWNDQESLVMYLARHNETRIFTDYWTCDRIAFQSQEHVVCSVLDDSLHTGLNRYFPYQRLVRTSVACTYVFAIGSPQDAMLRASSWRSVRHAWHDYAIYHAAHCDRNLPAR